MLSPNQLRILNNPIDQSAHTGDYVYLVDEGYLTVRQSSVTGLFTYTRTQQAVLGVQEPPQHSMIFNRRQPDGTFRPLSDFWEGCKS